ncbi:MAG: hypothetical protein ACJAQT_001939 [Akkermansiaceae bacterium]|jgi:hypothetical protein
MPAEGAEFIKARDVIEVFMSVEDGIDRRDFFPKGLMSEVGAAIDE